MVIFGGTAGIRLRPRDVQNSPVPSASLPRPGPGPRVRPASSLCAPLPLPRALPPPKNAPSVGFGDPFLALRPPGHRQSRVTNRNVQAEAGEGGGCALTIGLVFGPQTLRGLGAKRPSPQGVRRSPQVRSDWLQPQGPRLPSSARRLRGPPATCQPLQGNLKFHLLPPTATG